MTYSELYERIKLTFEAPPCPIDLSLRGFCTWDNEVGILVAGIGVAIELVGQDVVDQRCLDRNYRAELLDWEWHYTMHFEMAMGLLFQERIIAYNDTANYIGLPLMTIPQMQAIVKLKELYD